MSVDAEELREALATLQRLGSSESDFTFREISIEGQWMAATEVRREGSGIARRYSSAFWAVAFESDLQAGVFGPP